MNKSIVCLFISNCFKDFSFKKIFIIFFGDQKEKQPHGRIIVLIFNNTPDSRLKVAIQVSYSYTKIEKLLT